ncbi:MAG: DUF4396 domain-containing protein [Actinomycetota bacterium]|nr:DUF4396 domain-containing protein [Actinomycetota bacterium]
MRLVAVVGAGPIDGAIVLWFILVAVFTLFVAVDIRTTPEAPVMKVGFVVVTLYSGPFGAVLYALSCREPMPGTHEQFVAVKWRQVVGSTMHCVAGDGIGILAAATVTSLLRLPMGIDLIAEYVAGFIFGWTIFQALFMKGLMGSTYGGALRSTFLPEFLSMNGVMAGMAAVMVTWMTRDRASMEPTSAHFWFVMSIALSVGFLVAYPINWWLVDRGLKHGMMTVRPKRGPVPLAAGLSMAGAALGASHRQMTQPTRAGQQEMKPTASTGDLVRMSAVSLTVLAVGVAIASLFGDLTMSAGNMPVR